MVKLGDIASKAGVSIGTVERALYNKGRIAESTKERILTIADQLGYKPNMVAQGLAIRKKNIKLAFFYVDDEFSVLQSKIADDARQYSKKLESYGAEVIFVPLQGKMPEKSIREKNIWEFFKEKEIDGFASLGSSCIEINNTLEEHGKGRLPFVSYNIESNIKDDNELCFIGCDFAEAGRLAAGVAGIATGGKGKVCILSIDYPDLTSTCLRIMGFEQSLKKFYPEIELVDVLSTTPNDGFDAFIENLDSFLNYHHDIDVIYNVYAGSDEHSKKITKIVNKHKIKLISGDLTTSYQKELITKRYIVAEIAQDTNEQGQKTLETLFNYVAYGNRPLKKWIKTGVGIVLPESFLE